MTIRTLKECEGQVKSVPEDAHVRSQLGHTEDEAVCCSHETPISTNFSRENEEESKGEKEGEKDCPSLLYFFLSGLQPFGQMKYEGDKEEDRVEGLIGGKGQGDAGSDLPPTDEGEQEDGEEKVGPHGACHGRAVGNDVRVEEESKGHRAVGIEGGGDGGKQRLSLLAVTPPFCLLLNQPLLSNYLAQPGKAHRSEKIAKEEEPVKVGTLEEREDRQGERGLMEDNPLVRCQSCSVHVHTLRQPTIRVERGCHLGK